MASGLNIIKTFIFDNFSTLLCNLYSSGNRLLSLGFPRVTKAKKVTQIRSTASLKHSIGF